MSLDPVEVAAGEVEAVQGGGPEDGLHQGLQLLHEKDGVGEREEADVESCCLEQERLHLERERERERERYKVKGGSSTSVRLSPARVRECSLEVSRLARIASRCPTLSPVLLKPTTFRWHTALLTPETLSCNNGKAGKEMCEKQIYLPQRNRVQV